MSMLMLVCGSALAEDIIWQEDWSSVTDFAANPNNFNSNYSFTGTVLKDDGTVKSGTKFYNENLAGGEAPELLVAKNGGTFTVSPLPLTGHTGEMFLAFKANKNLTVTVDGATLGEANVTGNDYVYPLTVAEGQAHISITFENGLSQNVRLDNIKLYQGDAKKPAGLSWGISSRTVTIGADDNVFPTLSNENGLTVTYDSSDKTVATIDATGAITLVAAGTTDISATFEGDDEYEAQTVSYTLTVKEGSSVVPVTDIITVAKALEIIAALEDGKTTTETYQVKGFIVGAPDFQRKAEDGSLYGNVNLTIADEKGGTALLTVYRGKDLENKNFTEETISRIKEGDEVVFQGQLQKYVKDEVVTPELQNGYLISVNAGETPEPVGETVVFNFDDDYATLFPTLTGVSSGSGENYVADGDFQGETTSTAINGVTVTVSPDEDAKTPSRIWGTAPRLRMYSGTFTVSGKDIVKIEFTSNSNFYISTETGTLDGKTWTGEKADKVVFAVAKNTQLNKIVVTLDATTTAIQTISTAADNAPVYNLAGQRVMKAQKGLFIQNGKKFMVK